VSGLNIVAQMPVDQNGAEVELEGGGTPADPAGDGKASCTPVSLAMAGPLTAPDTEIGRNVKNGAELAVEQHNAANPGCQVELKAFDMRGGRVRLQRTASEIVVDPSIIGLVGPTWSGETEATGATFDRAGLVAVTPVATNPVLSEQGWKTFFRGVSSDAVGGPSLANYLRNELEVKKACVVDDGSAAGAIQTTAIAEALGPIADSACRISVTMGDKDFSAAVDQIVLQSPDVVIFGSHYPEAALLLQQLRDAGYTRLFAGPDGLKEPRFVKAAGQAARDAVMSCPCVPASGSFAAIYRKAFGQDPDDYSVEAYDVATIMLKGIDSGAVTRPALLDFVMGYDGQGLARKYRWTDTGELTSNLTWIYTVENAAM
jgi:branched-chain amino acid transport system substrate-binding protein